MKTLGLALGSGGSRGIAHIGFLQALDEEGIKPDFISGCSMGSVVGAAYSFGLSPREIYAYVKDLHIFDVVNVTMNVGGLSSTKKIRKLLEKHLGNINFSDLKIPFSCVAVDMITGEKVVFDKGDVLDAVIASSCMPCIFKPVEKDGMRLVDGGVLERIPAFEVHELGADVVVVVDVLGKLKAAKKCPNAIGSLLEMIDLADNFRTERRREDNKDIIDLWLEPNLGNMSQYAFKKFQFAYERGYETGKENIQKIKELLK